MQTTLPYNTNSVVFWLDPSEKFITRDKNLNVSSVVDRISGEEIGQSVGGNPAWSRAGLAGLPALVFNGQSIRLSLPNNIVLSGTKVPFSMTFVAKRNPNFSGTIVSIGSTTNNNPEMAVLSSDPTSVIFLRFDDAELDEDSITATDTGGIHVYTLTYDQKNFVARIDGVEVARAASTTNGHFTADQIVIGTDPDAVVNEFGPDNYIGSIGQVVMYYGSSPNQNLENLFLQQYNI
jgi:hypothetical protein